MRQEAGQYPTVQLRQEDFEQGTYRIVRPGTYVLAENISFSPGFPARGDWWYPSHSYSLGFFAAITIETSDVVLKLDHHKLEQAPEHALLQRFFSLIELCNRPFIPDKGPPQFKHYTDVTMACGSRVVIEGPGELGRSSHFAVHGNGNKQVLVQNLWAHDFEVAGIDLNAPNSIVVKNVLIGPSSTRVPVKASFSHAMFMSKLYSEAMASPELSSLADTTIVRLRGSDRRVAAVLNSLLIAVNRVLAGADPCHESPQGHLGHDDDEDLDTLLFCNPSGLPDGSAVYGFVSHKLGPAIHSLGKCTIEEHRLYARGLGTYGDVTLANVTIRGLHVKTEETLMVQDSEGKISQGPAGDPFQVQLARCADNDTYCGNVVSDSQVAMQVLADRAEALGLKEFEDFGGVRVGKGVLAWAAHTIPSWQAVLHRHQYEQKCLGDAMDHTNKGAVGARIEFVKGVRLDGVRILNVANHGVSDPKCRPREQSYSGAHARGLCTRYMQDATMETVIVHDIKSASGSALGWDMGLHCSIIAAKDVNTGDIFDEA